MSAPAPVVPLAFQNSAIHGNTLYTFQPNAFQSLDLSSGSKWNQLPMGVSVNGSQSVVAQSGGQDVLFVVGGRSNASETSFPGIQKYVFGSNSWEPLQPETSVAQNRVQHGAAYLQSTKSILLYGGSQDNSYTATSQTYTITADEPYTMKSYPAGAPLVQDPILMPYNASHALLAGGGAGQDQIWLFSEASGWEKLTTTIQGGVGDASKVQGAVVTDGSGKKQLELFDLSVSPNTVKNIALSDEISKRDEIVERDGAPSGAPTATRTGFSLAQANNLVVLTGGTQDKSAGPVAIFDQSANNWKDNQAVFGPSANTDSASATSNAGSSGDGSSSSSSNGGNSNSGAAGQQNHMVAASSNSAASPAASVAPASSGAPASSAGGSSAASAASGASSAPATAASATNSAAPSASGASESASASAPASGSASGSSVAATGTASDASNTASPSGSAAAVAAAAAASSSAAAAAAAAAAPSGGPSASSTSIILAAVLGSFFGIAAIFLAAFLLVRYRRSKVRQYQERQEALDEKRATSPASTVGTVNGKRSPFHAGQTPVISRPALQERQQAEDFAPPRRLNNDEGWNRYLDNNNTVENLYPGNVGAENHGGAMAAGAAAGAAAAGFGVGVMAGHAGSRDTQYTRTSEYTVDSPRSSHNGHESALIVPPLSTAHSRNMSTNSTIPEESAAGVGHDTWDPTANSNNAVFGRPQQRPASSIYYDRASSVYPTNPQSPDMTNFPPVPTRPTINTSFGSSGNSDDKGMRSIISKDFGANTDSGEYQFPESPARRVPPGSEPRPAGNATGRKEHGGDLSWVTFQN